MMFNRLLVMFMFFVLVIFTFLCYCVVYKHVFLIHSTMWQMAFISALVRHCLIWVLPDMGPDSIGLLFYFYLCLLVGIYFPLLLVVMFIFHNFSVYSVEIGRASCRERV